MKKTLLAALLLVAGHANATVIGGVDFPDGAISFVDNVVSFTPGPDVAGPYLDASNVLGTPDYTGPDGYNSDGAIALGDGGVLIAEFVDNSLTTSGDAAADLWIFEIGGVVEAFSVAISTDLVHWIELGSLSGQPTGIDIDPIAGVVAGTQYRYVRLSDNPALNQTNSPFGEADIDAIGAISSAPPAPVPAPGALLLLLAGIVSVRLGARARG